jgi:hypothetical protein
MVHNPLPVSRGEANWGGLEWNMILALSTVQSEEIERNRGRRKDRSSEGLVNKDSGERWR